MDPQVGWPAPQRAQLRRFVARDPAAVAGPHFWLVEIDTLADLTAELQGRNRCYGWKADDTWHRSVDEVGYQGGTYMNMSSIVLVDK